jgi:hypothetical protein
MYEEKVTDRKGKKKKERKKERKKPGETERYLL